MPRVLMNDNSIEELTEEGATILIREGAAKGIVTDEGVEIPPEAETGKIEEEESEKESDWEPVGYFSQSKSGKAYTIKIGDDYYSVYGKALESVVKGEEDIARVVKPTQ